MTGPDVQVWIPACQKNVRARTLAPHLKCGRLLRGERQPDPEWVRRCGGVLRLSGMASALGFPVTAVTYEEHRRARTRRSLTAGTTRRIDKERYYVERVEAKRAELLATLRYRVEPACRAELFTKLSFAAHRGELTLRRDGEA